MKTSIRKIPAVILLVVLCLTIFPISAFAAEVVEVQIPVRIELSGETPSPEETYTVVLQAADDAPMPAESTLKITGEGTAAFSAVTYTAPGSYCYMVTQKAGNHERGHYDEKVYYVRVTVTNGESGGLEAVVAAHTDPQMVSAKEDLVFENTYDPLPTPTPTLKPTVSSSTKPGTIYTGSGSNYKSGTTSSPKSTSSTQPVKTGDETNLALWICLCCVAGGGAFLIFAGGHRRRRGKSDQE